MEMGLRRLVRGTAVLLPLALAACQTLMKPAEPCGDNGCPPSVCDLKVPVVTYALSKATVSITYTVGANNEVTDFTVDAIDLGVQVAAPAGLTAPAKATVSISGVVTQQLVSVLLDKGSYKLNTTNFKEVITG